MNIYNDLAVIQVVIHWLFTTMVIQDNGYSPLWLFKLLNNHLNIREI